MSKQYIGGALAINGIQSASEIEGIQDLPENLVNATNHFLKEIAEEK